MSNKNNENIQNHYDINNYGGINLLKVIGLDIGNNSVKAYTEKKQLQYINTIKEVSSINISSQYPLITFNKKVFEVGNPVNVGSGGLQIGRYVTDNFKRECIFAIAQLTEGKGENLKIMLGIPVHLERDKDTIDTIKDNLIGSYSLKMNNENIRFNINEVMTIANPVNSLISSLFNTNGSKKEIHDNNDLVIVDIGWTGTSIVDFKSGKISRKDTITRGMSYYTSQLIESINKRHTSSQIPLFVESYYDIDRKFNVANKLELPTGTFDILSNKIHTNKLVAEEIYYDLCNRGYNFDKYWHIIFTGGGSITLGEQFKEVFNNDSRLIINPSPQMTNAIGLYLEGNNSIINGNKNILSITENKIKQIKKNVI